MVVQSYGWEESAVFCRMAWWRPLLLGQVVCRAPIGWQQPRGHPLYCHRRACPSPTLPTPPIWHIAGLSPRACERRVGEYRRGGNMSSRGEMRSFWIWARFWFQPPFQSQLSSVYHKKRCMGRIVEFCKHVPKFIRIQTLDSMMMWGRLRQTVRACESS